MNPACSLLTRRVCCEPAMFVVNPPCSSWTHRVCCEPAVFVVNLPRSLSTRRVHRSLLCLLLLGSSLPSLLSSWRLSLSYHCCGQSAFQGSGIMGGGGLTYVLLPPFLTFRAPQTLPPSRHGHSLPPTSIPGRSWCWRACGCRWRGGCDGLGSGWRLSGCSSGATFSRQRRRMGGVTHLAFVRSRSSEPPLSLGRCSSPSAGKPVRSGSQRERRGGGEDIGGCFTHLRWVRWRSCVRARLFAFVQRGWRGTQDLSGVVSACKEGRAGGWYLPGSTEAVWAGFCRRRRRSMMGGGGGGKESLWHGQQRQMTGFGKTRAAGTERRDIKNWF